MSPAKGQDASAFGKFSEVLRGCRTQRESIPTVLYTRFSLLRHGRLRSDPHSPVSAVSSVCPFEHPVLTFQRYDFAPLLYSLRRLDPLRCSLLPNLHRNVD
jgi:hypothetical protein